MNAAEKLVALSSLSNCATAAEHFCSITAGRASLPPIAGQLQDVEQLNGEAFKVSLVAGSVQSINTVSGDVQNTGVLHGKAKAQSRLKGEL